MPVAELLARMSSEELSRWLAYFEVQQEDEAQAEMERAMGGLGRG